MTFPVRHRSLAVLAWSRLIRVYQKLEIQSERHFRTYGLNSAWFDVLVRVGAQPGMTQGYLAESLLVTKGNVSQLVSKMVEAGLVVRRAEGRRQLLTLTEEGTHLRDQALPGQEELLEASLGGLSQEDQKCLVRYLKRWEDS